MQKENEKHLKTIENLKNKIAEQTVNINGILTKNKKKAQAKEITKLNLKIKKLEQEKEENEILRDARDKLATPDDTKGQCVKNGQRFAHFLEFYFVLEFFSIFLCLF